jgi:NAD(P)-dependent dehydrogenase (short-subunit alcohol dehydrogenase family)
MELYRAQPKDGIAWVTGASSGIGRHLALDLARQGYLVAATARSEDKLAELVAASSGLKGRIVPFACDVTDEAAMLETIDAIEAELGPVVLAVFNAGAYFPTRGYALETANFTKTYQVNVFGVIHGLVPVVKHMEARGRGHVAIIGSASAYGGLPFAAAYGASKAALNNMAEALKFDLDRMNIRIQIFNPGFIDTPFTKNNKFMMPALMPVEKASDRIVQGLERGGFEVTFPRRFTWFLKLINLLPHPIYFWFMSWTMGRRKKLRGSTRKRG